MANIPLLIGMMASLALCHRLSASPMPVATEFSSPRVTEHRGTDDLLTAGLGLSGLQTPLPPAFADPVDPSAAELRRRALWSNWRGIADLSLNGGYGTLYGSTATVPGREYSALAHLPGARHPHRVLVQVPDHFDMKRRCVVVSASSGSRGIYGAIAVAGAWGLPRGCAVAYTDKGAGTDYFDLNAQTGMRTDGRPGPRTSDLAFAPATMPADATGVAIKHAHSQDNPEADWGRHVRQAAEFALEALTQAFPQATPFRFDNTRVIAVGISNGGGAVLRAAEDSDDWLDAVVAGEPNIDSGGPGARSLYDYTTEAALLMPCALLDLPAQRLPQPSLRSQAEPLWQARCTSLKQAGVIEGADIAAQARSAHERLRAQGWTEAALLAGSLSVGLDLWRAIAVTYASAYGRYGVGEHPCGFSFAAQAADLSARPATAIERAAWWADSSGIAPGAGVGIVDTTLAAPDFTLTGLQCLRALYQDDHPAARRVQQGIAAVRAQLPRPDLPIIVVHGWDDGLIPPAFSSTPYVAQAQAAGRNVAYWQIHNAQHFDGFLALPAYAARYAPLLPYVYAALDHLWAQWEGQAGKATDRIIPAQGRGTGPLQKDQLAWPP